MQKKIASESYGSVKYRSDAIRVLIVIVNVPRRRGGIGLPRAGDESRLRYFMGFSVGAMWAVGMEHITRDTALRDAIRTWISER